MVKTIRLFQFNVDDRTVPLFGQSFCERASASPSFPAIPLLHRVQSISAL